jgi:hypothetical protein
MSMKKLFPFADFVVLAGCATWPRVISYEDASAFERSLLVRETTIPEAPEKLCS